MKKSKIKKFILLFFLFNFIYSFVYINNSTVIRVSNIKNKEVYPIGRTVGLKLYTNGVLVIGMSEIESYNNEIVKPYENTGIDIGDIIKSVNGNEIKNVSELTNIIDESQGNGISIKYERNNQEVYTTINPIKSIDGNYKIGLWVRDAAAGVGTLTYYDEDNSKFGALGHGIMDVDTGELLNISKGELVTSKIISIVKGKSKSPGEIRGTIDEGEKVGDIEKNTELGIYGNVTNYEYLNSIKNKKVSIADRDEIQIGDAQIICQLSNDDPQEYGIKIKKIYKNNSRDNKSMLIKVEDDSLIEKTGGIIPGMSGTPIIQNGKLVGAITNVMFNDPTQGYAVFADMMMQ